MTYPQHMTDIPSPPHRSFLLDDESSFLAIRKEFLAWHAYRCHTFLSLLGNSLFLGAPVVFNATPARVVCEHFLMPGRVSGSRPDERTLKHYGFRDAAELSDSEARALQLPHNIQEWTCRNLAQVCYIGSVTAMMSLAPCQVAEVLAGASKHLLLAANIQPT